MLRYKHFDEYKKLTSTAKTHLDNEFGYQPGIEIFDTYIEFWEERKFIGVLYGNSNFDKEIYIERFLVNKKYRNKGYGKTIVGLLRLLYGEISVESTEEAVGFYKALGFKRRKYQNCQYDDTIEMYLRK